LTNKIIGLKKPEVSSAANKNENTNNSHNDKIEINSSKCSEGKKALNKVNILQ